MSETGSIQQLSQEKTLVDPYDILRQIKYHNNLDLYIKPLTKDDVLLWGPFIDKCSKNSLYSRFMATIADLKNRGETFCITDYETRITIGVEVETSKGKEIIGIAWLIRDEDTEDVEVALLITDEWQHHGIGSVLAEVCKEIIIKWNIRAVKGSTSIYNSSVIHMLQKRKIDFKTSLEDNSLSFKLEV